MNINCNNIGGYSKVSMLFADQVKNFSISRDGVRLMYVDLLHDLPIATQGGVKLEAVPRSSAKGLIYQHNGVLILRNSAMNRAHVQELMQIQQRGCIIIATDNNGKKWVFGTKQHPLFGYIQQITGSRVRDLHKWQLTLSGKTLSAELPLM